MKLRDVYDKLHRGDALSSKELSYGIEKLSALHPLLLELGPKFYLAAKEVGYDLMRLEQIRDARKER